MARISQARYSKIVADLSNGRGHEILISRAEVRELFEYWHSANTLVVDDIAALREVDITTLEAGDVVEVLGYHVLGDHAGVKYQWDAERVTTDNNGTVIGVTSSTVGRFVMITYAEYDPRWFGCVGDDTVDDTVAFQRCVSQMYPGRTILVPQARVGRNLRFVMRLTDQIIIADAMWHGKIKCAGGAGGSFSTGSGYFPFHCDFDDPAKAQFLINATMEFENLRLFMDGNTTTAIQAGQNGSAIGMAPIISGANITSCGGHGILATRGVAVLDRIRIDHIDGVSGIKTDPGSEYVGIAIVSDGKLTKSEIAQGFHFGAVAAGNNWDVTDNYFDQCRIGMLVAGIEGRLTGNRFAFNWLCGLKLGRGALTALAGLDISGNSPRVIDVTGCQFHNNGEDRVGSSDNANSFDVWLDSPSFCKVQFSNCTGGNQIDNDTFDLATFGVIIAGTAVDRVSFSNCDFGGYTSGETILAAVTSAAWATTTAYTAGDIVHNAGHCYIAQNSGTSGATAPVHTDGQIVTDGAVLWGHIGLRHQDANSVLEFHNSQIEQGDSLVLVARQTWYAGAKVTDGVYDPAI